MSNAANGNGESGSEVPAPNSLPQVTSFSGTEEHKASGELDHGQIAMVEVTVDLANPDESADEKSRRPSLWKLATQNVMHSVQKQLHPKRKKPKSHVMASLSRVEHGIWAAVQPFVFFGAVWLIAAWLLRTVEHHRETLDSAEFDDAKQQLVNSLAAGIANATNSNATSAQQAQATTMLTELVEWLDDSGSCSTSAYDEHLWTWFGSLFYAFTLPTCIGYGSFAPTTTNGRLITFVFSLISIPIMMVCLSTISEILLAGMEKLAAYPKLDGQFRSSVYLRQVVFSCAFFTGLLFVWIVVVGGFGLNSLMDDDRTYLDGVYFAWISLSTIGLGDYVFDIQQSKGASILFITIGLAIFGLALSFSHRLLSLLIDKQRLRSKHLRIAELYSQPELTLVEDAFAMVDTDGSGDIDGHELQGLLETLGLHVSDSGVLDTLFKHDTTCSDTLNKHEWMVFMAPYITAKGKSAKFFSTLKFMLLSWAAIALWCAVGGYIMRALEKPHEEDVVDEWEDYLAEISPYLNITGEATFTNFFSELSNYGLCSYPVCERYSTSATLDGATVDSLFRCEKYEYDWDYQGSWFYCFTLITTIGYGSYVPDSDQGKIFSIWFSLIGILLFGNGISMISQLPSAIRGYTGDKFLRQLCGVQSFADEDRKSRERLAKLQLEEAELRARVERNRALPPDQRELLYDMHGMPMIFDSKAYEALCFMEGPWFVTFMVFLVMIDGVFLGVYTVEDHERPTAVVNCEYTLSAVFALDIGIRFALHGALYDSAASFFQNHRMRALDVVLVLIDATTYIVEYGAGQDTSHASEVKLLRALRALRLLRYFRLAKLLTHSAFVNHLVKYRAQCLCAFCSFLLVFAYMFISGYFVSESEGWTFWNSVFFIWISVTTIGLGDFVPTEDHYLFGAIWICVGLALLTEWLAEIQDVIHTFNHGSLSFEESAARLKQEEEEEAEHESSLVDLAAKLQQMGPSSFKNATQSEKEIGLDESATSSPEPPPQLPRLERADTANTQPSHGWHLNESLSHFARQVRAQARFAFNPAMSASRAMHNRTAVGTPASNEDEGSQGPTTPDELSLPHVQLQTQHSTKI